MYEQVRSVLQNRWIQALGAFLVLALVVFLFYLVSPILIPVFLALLVAYLLNPVVDFLERHGVRRTITTTVLALIGIAILVSVPVFLVPRLYVQAQQLVASAGKMLHGHEVGAPGATIIDRVLQWKPVEDFVRDMHWVPAGMPLTEESARALIARNIGSAVLENLKAFMSEYITPVTGAFGSGTSTMAGLIATVLQAGLRFLVFLANFSIFAFATGYLLVSFNKLVASSKEVIPLKYRETIYSVVGRIDHQIRSFIRGQFTVALCLAVLYIIGLTLVARVPFGFLIGIFSGLASFVPYLGVLMGLAISVLLVLVRFGADWHLIAVLATFVIAPTLEETILKPLIIGGRVGLHPVWIMAAILVFGHAFGFIGVLLAVPMAAALKVLVLEAYERYTLSKLYRAEAPTAPENAAAVVTPNPDEDSSTNPQSSDSRFQGE